MIGPLLVGFAQPLEGPVFLAQADMDSGEVDWRYPFLFGMPLQLPQDLQRFDSLGGPRINIGLPGPIRVVLAQRNRIAQFIDGLLMPSLLAEDESQRAMQPEIVGI